MISATDLNGRSSRKPGIVRRSGVSVSAVMAPRQASITAVSAAAIMMAAAEMTAMFKGAVAIAAAAVPSRIHRAGAPDVIMALGRRRMKVSVNVWRMAMSLKVLL